ncbi:MAG: hypothetical protein K2W94_00120 [Alphaproteobacteria bacterium]|nr:hypothetical protein [Alphaproteobacteria bacterium]
MRCFSHPIVESVGICKNCHKGLCPECLIDCDNGLACKGCENHVRVLNRFLDNSIHRKANSNFVTALMSGAFFIVFGISMWHYQMDLFAYIFILFGCFSLFNAYRYRFLK